MASLQSPDFAHATQRFERRSLLHRVLPAWRRAEGSALYFRSAWSSGAERCVLDLNQNAGTGIWGHHPPAALRAFDGLVEAGTLQPVVGTPSAPVDFKTIAASSAAVVGAAAST